MTKRSSIPVVPNVSLQTNTSMLPSLHLSRKNMRKSTKNILLIISSTLATWWEELAHWERPWCWERLKVGGEGDDKGWDVWMASLTQRTWIWASSGRWWRTGKPGELQSMGSQRVRHDLATEQPQHWTSYELLIKWAMSLSSQNVASFLWKRQWKKRHRLWHSLQRENIVCK